MATARTTEPGDTVTGYESQLWRMADALRGSMDAAEYKHVVLGRVYEYFLEQFALAEGRKGGDVRLANWAYKHEQQRKRI